MTRKLLLVRLLLSSLGWAQQNNTIPVNTGSIDMVTYVTAQIDALMAAGSPLLVNLGMNIVTFFAGTMFALLMIRLAFQLFHHHHVILDPWPILGFLFLVAGINTMLYYYATPIPGVGVSFGLLPKEIARYISGFIDVSTYNLLLDRIRQVLVNMQRPTSLLPGMELVIYWFITLNLGFLEAILFLVTIFGFLFYGLTQLVGPLFISFLLFPQFRQYFHGWLGTLIRFAFYKVAASAFIFIWAAAWLKFLDDVAGTNYTLENMLLMIVPMMLLNLATFLTAVRIPAWIDNVFSGGASAGHGGLLPFISRF